MGLLRRMKKVIRNPQNLTNHLSLLETSAAARRRRSKHTHTTGEAQEVPQTLTEAHFQRRESLTRQNTLTLNNPPVSDIRPIIPAARYSSLTLQTPAQVSPSAQISSYPRRFNNTDTSEIRGLEAGNRQQTTPCLNQFTTTYNIHCEITND